jgi:hypothetical protein
MGKDILGGVLEELGGLREPALERGSYLVQLRHGARVVQAITKVLHGVTCAVPRAFHAEPALRRPQTGAGRRRGDRALDLLPPLTQAFVGVGDHESDTLLPALHQRPEERLVVLGRARGCKQDGPLTGGRHADRDDGRDRECKGLTR